MVLNPFGFFFYPAIGLSCFYFFTCGNLWKYYSIADRPGLESSQDLAIFKTPLETHLTSGFQVIDTLIYGGLSWDIVLRDWNSGQTVKNQERV